MCLLDHPPNPCSHSSPPSTSLDKVPWTIHKLNPSTYLVRETDSYGEYPHIYARIFGSPPLILISDTGCGTSREHRSTDNDHDQTISTRNHTLYSFLSSHLNPPPSRIPYAVILSHCHYDHILGIPSFPTPSATFIASSHDKSFVSRPNLPTHSLCEAKGLKTPEYIIGHFAGDGEELAWPFDGDHGEQHALSLSSHALGIITLHIPGHTPDSLGWYDSLNRHLYVGDTFYERRSSWSDAAGESPMPIIFPKEGDVREFMWTLDKLLAFVRERNAEVLPDKDDEPTWEEGDIDEDGNTEDEDGWVLVARVPLSFSLLISPPRKRRRRQPSPEQLKKQRVLLSAAHVTCSVDAEEILLDVMAFFHRVLRGEVNMRRIGSERGEQIGFWEEEEQEAADGGKRVPRELLEEGEDKHRDRGWGRFNLRAPTRLILHARGSFGYGAGMRFG